MLRNRFAVSCVAIVGFCCLSQLSLFADGIRDNDPENVRQIPPPGIEVPEQVRQRLEDQANEVDQLLRPLRNDPGLADLIVDVDVLTRAVRTVLHHNEFFKAAEFQQADEILAEAKRRASQLAMSPPKHDWTVATGLVVRGFRSKIDDTPQPYGLVVPAGATTAPKRLDIWFHGRGERMSEIGFIHQRMNQVGFYAPPDTIVLHPYGRYSNAFKFAGETDVFEALESTQQRYAVDEERISVRGFSMGGAACWQFAVHYADRWFAANPGAGFCETPEFLRFFQKETLKPTWYEEQLWSWYDCNRSAINLLHCPTIAYSGELDVQKQAADVMAAALAEHKIDLHHVIGPKTKHTIHPDSKREIERRMRHLAIAGRDRNPRQIRFRTYTLKYNQMHWLTIDRLERHWNATDVLAMYHGHEIRIRTKNVTALTLDFPAGSFENPQIENLIEIDSQSLASLRPKSDRSLRVSFHRRGGDWHVGPVQSNEIHKRHGLQGPIDDAFMDSFIFVAPSGGDASDVVDQWASSEFERAIKHWRQHFRGDAKIRQDSELTDEDIESSHLVLFGTPSSNKVISRVLDRLPIVWNQRTLTVREPHDASHHVPILVYPNPLNQERYVVLNSGFTYREYAYLNNARQVPMLPDWAVVDVSNGTTTRLPGRIVDADFFDESWKLKPRTMD